jgi:hypothetical protein
MIEVWTKARQFFAEKTSIGLDDPNLVSRTARSPGAAPTSTQLPAVEAPTQLQLQHAQMDALATQERAS